MIEYSHVPNTIRKRQKDANGCQHPSPPRKSSNTPGSGIGIDALFVVVDAAESAADQRTGRMPNKLYLAQGQPVLLTRNLWTECGLVNGARGVVKGMLMDESGDKVRWVALVHFPDYSGPAFSRNHPKCVPIG